MKRFVRRTPLIGLGLGLGLAIGVAYERHRAAEQSRAVTTAQVFQNVLAAIRVGYVDSLTDDELYAKAAKGVVSTLGDPYSAFLGPDEYHSYRDLLTGRARSIGISVVTGLTGLRVGAVAPKSAADRSPLEPGDYLLAINDEPAAKLSTARAASLLRGSADQPVRVRYRGPGDSVPVEVSLAPVETRLPSTLAAVRLSDSVAYVALGNVSSDASRDLREALNALDAGELSGLVLDLRGNGGGPLEEALAIADLFLEPGQRIGAVSKRRSLWATYAASGPVYFPKLSLAILVDRRTASSAEIIAAALRDNDRARLVGERTFGKDLIQTTVPLGNGAALRLTTGRWQGPGGALIAGGIQPDSVVVAAPEEAMLRRALGREPEAFAQGLDAAAATLDSLVPLDSIRLSPAGAERLRSVLRPTGIQLSRRMVARHQPLFDLELRRVAAAIRQLPSEMARYGLLADPVVAAGLIQVSRRP
jgi:carboxyl-terminal processing protease